MNGYRIITDSEMKRRGYEVGRTYNAPTWDESERYNLIVSDTMQDACTFAGVRVENLHRAKFYEVE